LQIGLEVDTASRLWRRRLGWLTWAVLEDVALSAYPDTDGWAAPVGARAVAQNLGMTKDTAAKALAALAAAGIVERVNVHARDAKVRSGYRINLPEGVSFKVSCHADAPANPGDRGGHDSSCEENPDAPNPQEDRPAGRPVVIGTIGGAQHTDVRSISKPRNPPPRMLDEVQGRLFDPETLSRDEGSRSD
jgi:hypothetical protein